MGRIVQAMTALMALMALAFLVASADAPAVAQNKSGKAMIVLDASGSMWGQISGEAKISIARRVLSDVLSASPNSLHLGLMAYGHRKKGQCDDIQLLIEPAAGSAAEISKLAGDIKPKGKTPLSEAVKQAAQALKFEEEKATVILITDGLETCNADPCALGNALESSGVDFTAHVVGFGLSAEEGRQVACLAENTGGRYLPAQDAESLGDALNETVTQAAAVQPEDTEPEPEVLPDATVSGPDSVEIGRRFTATWTGSGEKWDRISLFDNEARNGEGREITGRLVRHGEQDKREVRLVAPVRPGTYTLQYRYGSRGRVIGSAQLAVVDAAVSLDAPATVDIGRKFVVGWVGPGGRHDRVQVIDPLANNGDGKVITGKLLRNDDVDNRKVSLIAPAKPGFYRLQYWNGDNRAELATRQIEVLEAEVSITAPDSVAMATSFKAQWVGPGGRRDRIDIIDPAANGGKGKNVGGKRLVNDDFDNQTVTLVAPAKTGEYILQYYNGDNRAVLATRPLAIAAMEVSLDAPEAIVMGHLVRIKWTGPGARRDRIEIWDAGAQAGRGKVVGSKRIISGDLDANLVEIIVPVKPGEYTLRYWNGDSRVVLAEKPLTVEPMDVRLEAPDTTETGTLIEIEWQGPGGRRDAVQFFNSKDGKVHASKRLISGDYDDRKVTVKAPAPGEYSLRYWSGDFGTVLVERPISVQ
jgi:Ca-activated chloride channel family protein